MQLLYFENLTNLEFPFWHIYLKIIVHKNNNLSNLISFM